MSSQGAPALRVSPRKATPPKPPSKQPADTAGAGAGAGKRAARTSTSGRTRGSGRGAAATAADSSSDEDDGGMPENVLYQVKDIVGRRVKHGEVQYRVDWAGWPKLTWEPLGNLTECQTLVERYDAAHPVKEEEQKGASASAGRALRAKHKREEKEKEHAKAEAEVLPRSKRVRKSVEKFEPIDFETERALRQEEQLEQLFGRAKQTGGAGTAAAGEDEEDEDAEDEYEITKIIGKKKDKGVTMYLCEWAPIGDQTFEPTFEPEENINAKNFIAEFEERSKRGRRRGTALGATQTTAEAPPSKPAVASPEALPESVGIINEDEEDEDTEDDVVMMISSSALVHESSSAVAASAIPAATVAAAFADADADAQLADLRPLPLDPRPSEAPAESMQQPTVAVSMLLPLAPSPDAEPMMLVGIINEDDESEEEQEQGQANKAEPTMAEPLDFVVPESQLRPSFETTDAAAAPLLSSPPPTSIVEDERKSVHAPRTEAAAALDDVVGLISPSPSDPAAADEPIKAPSVSPPPRSGGVGGIASKISHWVHSALGVPEDDEQQQLQAARKQEHKSQKREG